MWNNSARLMIIRVQMNRRREWTIPVSVWAVNEFMEALTELAGIGGAVLKCLPLPKEEKARHTLTWLKRISPAGITTGMHDLIKDLMKYRGLEIVNAEVEGIRVRIIVK